MDSSEHDSSSTTDGDFYSSTASANLHWYYYWSSQVGYSDLSQMNGSGSGHWNYYVDQSQSGSYSDFESTSQPIEAWNPLNQGQANYHCLEGSTGHLLPQVSPDSVLQTPIDRGYYHHEPFFSSWAPEAAVSSHTGIQNRRPSYHSDPGLPTYLQDNAIHQSHTDLRPNAGFGIVTTSNADIHGIDRANAPLADPSLSIDPSTHAEPSSSASTSPVGAHVNRPAIRCYDHGCDGRTFSSISNYRRHQRERAGRSAVCFCPRCGAAFYRRWTRDHHVERGSCLRTPRWS
jgi:hypothetical protein